MRLSNYRILACLLVAILLVNPLAVYLYFHSAGLTILIVLLLVGLTYLIATRGNHFLVYYFNFLALPGLLLQAEVVFTYGFGAYIIRDLYRTESTYYFNKPLLREHFEDKEFSVDYWTNAQGFRIGRQDDPNREVQEVDWLFLGDSYTQGAQVEYEQLYTSQLYRSFPDKIILNAGISGFGIPDAYEYYHHEGRKLHPRKVFLQVCNFNDFMNVQKRKSDFSTHLMEHFNLIRSILYPLKFANPAELPLGRWTEPFYPQEQQNIDFNIFYKATSLKKERDLQQFAEMLHKLNDAVKQQGAELIVLQIPTKEQLYYKYFTEVVDGFGLSVAQLDMNRPNHLLDSLCRSFRLQRLDLTAAFSKAPAEVFFQFDEHLNALGHQTLATALAEQLRAEAPPIRYLSQSNAGDRYPAFDSSGTRLCFQSFRDGNMELFVTDSSGTHPQRLTYNSVPESHPHFLDKDLLIFTQGDQARGNTTIVSMNLTTGVRQPLSQRGRFAAIPTSSSHWLCYPEWGIDGDGSYTQPRIALRSRTNRREVYLTPVQVESWKPVLSPDEKVVFYISKRNSIFDLYAYNLLTKKEVKLTHTPYDEWDPAISPDGSELVYAARMEGNWDLFRMKLATRQVTRLTRTKGQEWDPVYSPDGYALYFAGEFGLRNGIYRLDLAPKPR
jgi:lysophospholipase L1-like esterase